MIEFEFEVPDYEDLLATAVPKGWKHAGVIAMQDFIKKRLAKRFDGSMAGPLHYKARDDEYLKSAKRRLKKPHFSHNYTGRASSASKRTATPKAGFSKGSGRVTMRVVLSGLHGGYARGAALRRKSGIDLRKEMGRFTADELTTIAAIATSEFEKFIQTSPDARRKTRRRLK